METNLERIENVLENFCQKFISEFNNLKNLNIINERTLTKYSEFNIHSILQYCIIKAGTSLGFISIPEYKINLIKSIDKYEIDERFKGKKIRYQHKIAVDVAFIDHGKVIGFCEIFTPDEIHGISLSKELSVAWITPRHKLEHLVRYSKPSLVFGVIVNLFNTLPSWQDARRHTLNSWRKLWVEFVENLSKYIHTTHIVISDIDDITYTIYEKQQ